MDDRDRSRNEKNRDYGQKVVRCPLLNIESGLSQNIKDFNSFSFVPCLFEKWKRERNILSKLQQFTTKNSKPCAMR